MEHKIDKADLEEQIFSAQRIQQQEPHLVNKNQTLDKQVDVLEDPTCDIEPNIISNKSLQQQQLQSESKEPTKRPPPTTITNTIIIANNIKCQIFNNLSTTINAATSSSISTTGAAAAATTKAPSNINNNNKKRHYLIVKDKKHNFRQQQPQNTEEEDTPQESILNDFDLNCLKAVNSKKTDSNSTEVESAVVPCKVGNEDHKAISPTSVNRCIVEEFEVLDSSDFHHHQLHYKRGKSFRRNSSTKKSNGSVVVITSSKDNIVASSPKLSKHRPRSPTKQNSDAEPITGVCDSIHAKKRFSYCSSCSSSNSCNCDITGENSNTLYEGFGIGVVVSSSYTDNCSTGSSGTVSLTSAANGQGPLAFRGGPSADNNSLGSPQRHGEVEYCKNFSATQKDNDASDNCSDFDETCSSSEPSLIEELARVETENKILSNNLKNYSKFHEKLYKKQQRISHFTNRSQAIDDSADGDVESRNYQIQDFLQLGGSSSVPYEKDSLEHNIFLSYSNNSLYFNTMNFDAGIKTDGRAEVLTRTGLGPANSVGVDGGSDLAIGGGDECDTNDVNNIYGKRTYLDTNNDLLFLRFIYILE